MAAKEDDSSALEIGAVHQVSANLLSQMRTSDNDVILISGQEARCKLPAAGRTFSQWSIDYWLYWPTECREKFSDQRTYGEKGILNT